MLFISILTWKPDKRNEIIARRAEKGAMVPEGITMKGEWVDLCGSRDIALFETDSPQAMMVDVMGWSDLMSFETFPVMDAEEVMGAIKAAQ
jgi:hypothetical protein